MSNIALKVFWSNEPMPLNRKIDRAAINVPFGVLITHPTCLIKSVNGKVGDVVLNAADVGADAAGSAEAVQQNLNTEVDTLNSQLDSLLTDLNNLSGTVETKASAASVLQALSTKADLINGIIPAAQLPSFVDDVLVYPTWSAFPVVGEVGKIYVTEDTNKTYRWSGSGYVVIADGVALGETATTAYRGDRGKAAYDHSLSQGNPHNTTTSEINEGAKLFFTEPRVRNTVLTGLVTNNSTNVTNADTVEVAIGKLEAKSQGSSSMPLWVNLRTLDSFFIATSVPNQTINCNIEFQKRNGNVYMRGYFGTNGNLTNTSLLFFHRSDSYYCDAAFSKIMGEYSNITKLTNIPIYGTNSSGVMLTGLLQIEQGSAAIAAYNFSGRNLEQNIVWHIPEVCLGKSFI